MDIGVLTIVYDGYGKFLKEWFDCVFHIKPRQAVVVLSRKHGLKYNERNKIIKKAEEFGVEVKFITKRKRLSMGALRNSGIEEMDTEWILYFSADDVLYRNTKKEIEAKKDADVVALKYHQRISNNDVIRETPIPEPEKFIKWRKFYGNAGYIAFRRKVWEEIPYEDTDYPNFPFMFHLVVAGYKWEKTDNPCAIYLKRTDSHSGKRTKEQDERACRTLDISAEKNYNEYCKRMNIDYMDVVYLLDTRKQSKILPLSIKTLKNIRHRNIFIVGKKPRGVEAEEIHFEDQQVLPIENTREKLRAIIEDERVSDDFILMNDDFLILQEYEYIPYYHQGAIKEKAVIVNDYWRQPVKQLYKKFPQGKMFNVHFPIVYNKKKLARILNQAKGSIRTYYCNYYNIKGEQTEDYKTYQKSDIKKYKDAPFLSTTDTVEHTRLRDLEKLVAKRL